MARNITSEPCTLVYTLLDTSAIPFDDFHLIVRSLHSYMVEDIIPHPENFNVHVKLQYQASIANAEAKLGDLAALVSVTKLSSFIKDSEISRLEQLKRRFNIGATEPAPGPSRAKQSKKGAGRRINPYARQPYKAPKLQTVYDVPRETAEPDSETSD